MELQQSKTSFGEKENYGFVIPTAYCHAISTDDFQIAGMRVRVGSNQLDGIVSCVKSKLVEVIMELEKEFENLDELDIRSQIKENESVKQVIYNIENIIYDKSGFKSIFWTPISEI